MTSSKHIDINKLKIKENFRDSFYKFVKGFCLSIVKKGVSKCSSNAAILKNYQTALDSMKIYHDFIFNYQASEIDKKLVPPVALDHNNISISEKAILNEYQTSEDSTYWKIKSSLF